MTVKTQGGKVILKNGKVSCSCCECCMYPAQALADGDYAASDLPNTVTIGGVGYSLSGTSYGNTTNGVIFEGTVWAKYTNGARSSRPCLIQGGIEDQFADTYTVTAGPYSATVSRIDICNWIGTDSCGNPVSLAYASGEPYTEPFKWFASIYFYNGGPCDDPGAAPLPGYKEGNQNTPIGEYQNGLTVS